MIRFATFWLRTVVSHQKIITHCCISYFRVEQKSPAIFSGGGHQFKSEIGLFRQLAGTQLFAARVQSGSQIELGENVQLRSIVRSGDGWNYSKLTDVIIQR